jgi:large subunit ribosomal protein L23
MVRPSRSGGENSAMHASANTSQVEGKKKRERRADFGRRAHWKKAVVTLAKGEKIDIA